MSRAWKWAAILAVGTLFSGGHVAAQEMSFRSGVITGISPMQVEVASTQQAGSSQGAGAFGRALGRMAGRAASRVAGEHAYEAYEIASGTTHDIVGSATAPGPGTRTVTAYMVMMRFDDGGESAIRAADAGNLRVGARARVFGTGAGAQIVAE